MKLVISVIILVVILILLIIIFSKKSEYLESPNKSVDPNEIVVKTVNMGSNPSVPTTMRILHGSKSMPPVILLHNSPTDSRIWEFVLADAQKLKISERPTIITYDIRGHGSAWVPVDHKFNDPDPQNHAWSLDLLVNDLETIVSSAGVNPQSKFVLAGYGFGGIIAQGYALKHPKYIAKLVLLQTSVTPMPHLEPEIKYLGGRNGWIYSHPGNPKLTNGVEWAQKMLCGWFYLPNNVNCDGSHSQKITHDESGTPEYKLAAQILEGASATTTLQADKLLVATNLEDAWIKIINVPFPITITAATDDPMAPPSLMAETYSAIYNNNREADVVFDIVEGKHGFTILHPKHILSLSVVTRGSSV